MGLTDHWPGHLLARGPCAGVHPMRGAIAIGGWGGCTWGCGMLCPFPCSAPWRAWKGPALPESSTMRSGPAPRQPKNPQEMLRSRGQCWQHGHRLPPAQGFELHAQPLLCTVALQHPLHKAGAGVLPWYSIRFFAAWVGQEDGQSTESWWA